MRGCLLDRDISVCNPRLAAWLLRTAFSTDHGPTLVAALLEELRVRRIVCPPLPAIERLSASVRARAQRQLMAAAHGRSDRSASPITRSIAGDSCRRRTKHAGMAPADCLYGNAGQFPKLVERLTLVRSLGIDPERATRVHQNYWLKLAREGGQSTVQHLAELEPVRRYATLTALVLELTATRRLKSALLRPPPTQFFRAVPARRRAFARLRFFAPHSRRRSERGPSGGSGPCWHRRPISLRVSDSNRGSARCAGQWEGESRRGGQNTPVSGTI
jgi:hypothetical protein